MKDFSAFFSLLKNNPQPGTFNPWFEVDRRNDINKESPSVRRRQLKHYLAERQNKAKILLLGEALGYQGGHFSGIAMMSERILLGKTTHPVLNEAHILGDLVPQRTSRPEIKANGFTEPTATIVWKFMLSNGFSPLDFVIWNSFPWHPFRTGKILSNRTPSPAELASGQVVLRELIPLFNFSKIVAVGNKAAESLEGMGILFNKVRHPANGGAGKFAAQMRKLLDS